MKLRFSIFNQSCGMQLDVKNKWVVLAGRINWEQMKMTYAKMFKSNTGHPAKPFRMALGALIIQKHKDFRQKIG